MNFVVPQNSPERTISNAAAYLVYGFGGTQYPVAPWTDIAEIFQRNASSGTQAMISAVIGVGRDRWFGQINGSSTNMRDSLVAAGRAGGTIASHAIGILSSDFTDPMRSTIRQLGFQDQGQRCAFWPDSSSTATDKRNVRDGHYPIAGPLHMLTRVDTSGVPLSANAYRLLNVISGAQTLTGLDIIDTYAQHGIIPQCAMRVTRAIDGDDIQPFAPPVSCGCYFEERATGLMPTPGCTQCDRSTDCPPSTPNCNRFANQTRGYCEP
jgi:hypothetical protein